MTEAQFYDLLCRVWIALAIVVGLILLWIPAPYGRYVSQRAGPMIPGAAGWMIMESVSLATFVSVFVSGPRRSDVFPLALGAWWVAHYAYRALVQPLRQRGRRRPMPLGIVLCGVCFNLVNAYLNARWLTALGPIRTSGSFLQAPFVIGAALGAIGAAINVLSDETLLGLRVDRFDEYGIPRGGLFRWLSCPNYLGEIIEWIGWAIATWSVAGASFAIWTAANLVPRSRAHHCWYRQRFADYPPERRALVPGLF